MSHRLEVFPSSKNWLRRFGFRLLATYLILYNLGSALSLIPWIGSPVAGWIYRFWRTTVPWVGQHMLPLAAPISLRASGSGDKLFDWVQVWCYLALALLVAMVWVWFDKERRRDEPVRAGVKLGLRYVLGATLIGYGLAKLIPPTQFPEPGYARLLQPYGEFSPMGVLWTFMGTSPVYVAFAGVMELLGGLLLFFRRTTTLGSLIIAGVMTNVVLLNFCYDVPVKLYSSHLLFFAIWLAWPDAQRLWNVLFLNRATHAVSFAQPWSRRWMRWMAIGLKVLVMIGLLKAQLVDGWLYKQRYVYHGPTNELVGLWDVQSYYRNQEAIPASMDEQGRWLRISISDDGRLIFYAPNGQRRYAQCSLAGEHFILTQGFTQKTRSVFKLVRMSENKVRLEGKYEGSDLIATLERAPERRFILKNRGFHWISEEPFNR